MRLNTLTISLMAALVAITATPVNSFAQSTTIITFQAKISRTILPAGEKLAHELTPGANVTGTIELTETDADRFTTASGGDSVEWINAVKKIQFDGGLTATFHGGMLYVQEGLLQLQGVLGKCPKCSAVGEPFKLIR